MRKINSWGWKGVRVFVYGYDREKYVTGYDYRAILIAGQTASGKSGLALRLAEHWGGVIINADSMQVYRELQILTARPTDTDQARAPHRLYGFVSARERYSVGRWLEDIRPVLFEAWSSGKTPIIVGGTGLYFRALLTGLPAIPAIPDTIRRAWQITADERPGELHGLLKARDPEMAARLRPSDRQRLVRALEVLEATGRSLRYWQEQPGEPLLGSDQVMKIVLAPDRTKLYARCDQRFEAMLAAGALNEVAHLMTLELDPRLPAMRALGVPPLIRHLDKEMTLTEAATRAKAQTRQYAKRQMTWLRRNMVSWQWYKEPNSEKLHKTIMPFATR